MAFKVKLPIMECGTHYDHKFRWWLQDENGQRVATDLTGYKARMDTKKGNAILLRLTTGNDYIKPGGNVIHFDVSTSATDAISFTKATCDLLLLPNGEDDRWFCSELVVWSCAMAGHPIINKETWRVPPQDLLEVAL